MTVARKTMELVKALIFAYLVTGIILALMAYGVYKYDLSETIIHLLITATYVVTTFAGAFLVGKRVKEKKFVWGALLGALYVGIIYACAYLLGESIEITSVTSLTTFAMCFLGGLLGGMIS